MVVLINKNFKTMKAHTQISMVNLTTLPMLTKIEVVKGYISRLPKSGGFSVNLNLQQPEKGYMVGGYSDVYEQPTNEQIEQLLKRAVDVFYIGGWIDNGKVYIELSRQFESLKAANLIGGLSGQIAIYDVVKKESIYL